jgi:hypothetical protein
MNVWKIVPVTKTLHAEIYSALIIAPVTMVLLVMDLTVKVIAKTVFNLNMTSTWIYYLSCRLLNHPYISFKLQIVVFFLVENEKSVSK